MPQPENLRTVQIEKTLHEKVKARAAMAGKKINEYVEVALKVALKAPVPARKG